jgi:acetyl-CoA carboxylase biotin carboxyl carrier protein
MSEREPTAEDSADVRTIRQLVKLMHRFGLSAIDLRNEATTIRIRRGVPGGGGPAPSVPVAVASAPAAAPAAPAVPAATAPAAAAREATYIRSPMVGTFYESPAPDAKAYVGIGSAVRPDTIVCLIEAMKVFTEINAGLSGTVAEVLVKSGQPVEFDQPLFRLDPA